MQAQHTDRQKAVPMFNAFQSKGQDDISRWLAKVSENPIVEAFPEKIDIHPGMDSSMLLSTEMPAILSELVSKPRTRRTVAYINVPYCETRCFYCLFYIKPYRNKEESKAFADTLIKELQLWSDKPVQKGEPVHAVYFGGGTPTALEASDIERVIKAVRRYLPLANDCEITYEGRLSGFGTDKMEAALAGGANRFSLGVQSFDTKIRQAVGRRSDKETYEGRLSGFGTDKMEAALAGGANRFSLGVQSFDTKIRQAVGRRSDKETLIRQLEKLMSYDQAAIVIDLIYGFPFQTLETWKEDLRIGRELNLDGIDCYQLRVFEKSPLYKTVFRSRPWKLGKKTYELAESLTLTASTATSSACLRSLLFINIFRTANFLPDRIMNFALRCSRKPCKACMKQAGSVFPSPIGLQTPVNEIFITTTQRPVPIV